MTATTTTTTTTPTAATGTASTFAAALATFRATEGAIEASRHAPDSVFDPLVEANNAAREALLREPAQSLAELATKLHALADLAQTVIVAPSADPTFAEIASVIRQDVARLLPTS
ncbi:hypothetical protein [Rhodoplanes azumiensis]|uniref:Uncharacterized protein n=1 Tax=Rhodoplanes azumiensis TaxID=1897628 RepID=A0ABW5AT20_9BRAD